MQVKKSMLALYIWMRFCLLVHHNYIDHPDFEFLFGILFVMTHSTVLVYLLLAGAVSSAASQPERINVTVLQSDGDQCPPADQLEAVRSNVTEMIRAFIKINSTRCSCGGGDWMRVANLDMTDQTQQCPSGFRNVESPRRSCGRPESDTCVSAMFPVNGVEYSRVCGRIIGYQFGSPNAFREGPNPRVIDGLYVEGVSLTHGSSPRKHIWTFPAALHENASHLSSTCQCTRRHHRSGNCTTVCR